MIPIERRLKRHFDGVLEAEAPSGAEREDISMKQNFGSKRLFAMLLSVAMLVCLVCVSPVKASAEGALTFLYAQDCWRTPAFPKAGDSVSLYNISKPYGANGVQCESAANWVLTPMGLYTGTLSGSGTYFTSIISSLAKTYGIRPTQVQVYELTRDGAHIAYGGIAARSDVATIFIGDNYSNAQGCGFLLTNELVTGSITTTIQEDVSTVSGGTPAHTHSWTVTTTGNGTQKAETEVKCTGCDVRFNVFLETADITLPADYHTPIKWGGWDTLPEGITVSEEPGIKYSATGSNYETVPANEFDAKQGHYQASILVMNGNEVLENLYVNYTAIDPKATAATGDNRPMELIIASLGALSAMASAAFLVDCKRKAG